MKNGICTNCNKETLIYKDSKLCENCDIIERDLQYMESQEYQENNDIDNLFE